MWSEGASQDHQLQGAVAHEQEERDGGVEGGEDAIQEVGSWLGPGWRYLPLSGSWGLNWWAGGARWELEAMREGGVNNVKNFVWSIFAFSGTWWTLGQKPSTWRLWPDAKNLNFLLLYSSLIRPTFTFSSFLCLLSCLSSSVLDEGPCGPKVLAK